MSVETLGCCFRWRRRLSVGKSEKQPVQVGHILPIKSQFLTTFPGLCGLQSGRHAKPKLEEYCFEAGKQTIQVLQVASGLIGVPFARDAINIALALITACEVRRHLEL
jgi:hypothetical protein